MASSFWSWQSTRFAIFAFLLELLGSAHAFTSSEYSLDLEFSGTTFFDGWDFFTDADPTLGFVSYYSQLAAQQAGLVRGPYGTEGVYIGVDHVNKLSASGPGRPSVRITSKKNWTHGLFIGDFNHIPAGVCGTWPAFWTLGPNWPYTGEIDILEGVNDIETNSISLHTNETCVITGNTGFQSGVQGGTDCAVYPGQNAGCGVVDRNTDSYSNFNNVGGGVYAMQWTSDYIRVWFWARNAVPKDIIAKTPVPSAWGKPVANMESPNCLVDKHFLQHNIVIDTTFCGAYAGSIWPGSTCQAKTGYNDCNSYVAANPQAFTDSYWSINSIRVYQLADPAASDVQVPLTSALHSTSIGPNPVTKTYAPPFATLTAISNGLITTTTTKYDPFLTHPIFNTTSVDPNAIGSGMGTFAHSKPTIPHPESVLRVSVFAKSSDMTKPVSDVIINSDSNVSAQTSSVANTSTEYLVQPSILANFEYSGCKGISGKTQGFILAETSVDMSVQRCINECNGDFFAGVFGQYCFCGTEVSETEGLVSYPAEYCNAQCPGDQNQLCGGIILPGQIVTEDANLIGVAGKAKRQASYPLGSTILFSVYNKIDLLVDNATMTTTETSTIIYTETLTISELLLTTLHTPDQKLVSGPQTTHYDVTATDTATSCAISTTWYDYCAICLDYRTTQSTTITVVHCGYTAQADERDSTTLVTIPTIPMMTTARSCACGEGGAASTTIVTIPCPSGIAALQSSPATTSTAAPGVFLLDAASGASAQTFIAPTSTATPFPCPETITQTFTLQSVRRSAIQLSTSALPSAEHKNRIVGPVIPIPVPRSGSFLSLHNASNTGIYNIPVLSQPHPSSSGSTRIRQSTSGVAAVPTESVARSAATKTRTNCEDGFVGYILFMLNLLVVGAMLVL